MATTTVINIAQAVRNGVFQADAPQAVPGGIRFATIEVVLDLADKLAVGKTMDVETFFAPTFGGVYTFANGIVPWTSYGPGGLTVTTPTGVLVNPNPTVHVPLLDKIGLFIRGFIDLKQPINAGLIVTITT